VSSTSASGSSGPGGRGDVHGGRRYAAGRCGRGGGYGQPAVAQAATQARDRAPRPGTPSGAGTDRASTSVSSTSNPWPRAVRGRGRESALPRGPRGGHRGRL
jgi:hypothetical protein